MTTKREAIQTLRAYAQDSGNDPALRLLARVTARSLKAETKRLDYLADHPERRPCPRCNGDGIDGIDTDDPCTRCNGYGTLLAPGFNGEHRDDERSLDE